MEEGKITIGRKRRKLKKDKYQGDEKGVNGRRKDINWMKKSQIEVGKISMG
jgi:hypothetical protein